MSVFQIEAQCRYNFHSLDQKELKAYSKKANVDQGALQGECALLYLDIKYYQ